MVHFVDFITTNNRYCRFSYHFVLEPLLSIETIHLLGARCCFTVIALTIVILNRTIAVNVIFILGFKSRPGTALEKAGFLNF